MPPAFFSPVTIHVALTYHPRDSSFGRSSLSSPCSRRSSLTRTYSDLTENGPGSQFSSTPVRRRRPFTYTSDENLVSQIDTPRSALSPSGTSPPVIAYPVSRSASGESFVTRRSGVTTTRPATVRPAPGL